MAAGLVTYAVALIATLPARIVMPHASDAAGTVWHGAATLPGGAAARWDASLARSLGSGGIAGVWTIDGPGTLLTGVAAWRLFAGPDLTGVAGRAAWPLVAAALPGLPRDCAITLDIAVGHASAQGLHGTVRTLPGSCPGTTPGSSRAIPRMIATFDGAVGRVTPWTDRATTYATVAVAGGQVHMHITPAGAAVLPGPGRTGDIDFAL